MGTLLDQIRAEMDRQNLTAYALAKRAEVQPATVSRILTGTRPNPAAETLERLAAALGGEFVLKVKSKHR